MARGQAQREIDRELRRRALAEESTLAMLKWLKADLEARARGSEPGAWRQSRKGWWWRGLAQRAAGLVLVKRGHPAHEVKPRILPVRNYCWIVLSNVICLNLHR